MIATTVIGAALNKFTPSVACAVNIGVPYRYKASLPKILNFHFLKSHSIRKHYIQIKLFVSINFALHLRSRDWIHNYLILCSEACLVVSRPGHHEASHNAVVTVGV